MSGRDVQLITKSTWKPEARHRIWTCLEPILHERSGLIGQFVLDRPSGLALDGRRARPCSTADAMVATLKLYEIAAPQLATGHQTTPSPWRH